MGNQLKKKWEWRLETVGIWDKNSAMKGRG